MRKLLLVILMLYSSAVFAQEVRISAQAGYSANNGVSKSSSLSAGGEIKYDGDHLGGILRGQVDHENKAYSNGGLVGVAERLNVHARVKLPGGIYLIPGAMNLRRVRFKGSQGYTKYGVNFGVGAGLSLPGNIADFTGIYYFKDRFKFDKDVNGVPIGNEVRGFNFEANGYFPFKPGSDWFYGHAIQIGFYDFIDPYHPGTPRYKTTSYQFGFRIGKRVH